MQRMPAQTRNGGGGGLQRQIDSLRETMQGMPTQVVEEVTERCVDEKTCESDGWGSGGR